MSIFLVVVSLIGRPVHRRMRCKSERGVLKYGSPGVWLAGSRLLRMLNENRNLLVVFTIVTFELNFRDLMW